MLSLSPRVRIFAAVEPVDFRKGFDRLVQVVRDECGEDPFAGDLFCFFNRRRDRVKVLVWDRNGFWLHRKRLERGTFERLAGRGAKVEIERALAKAIDYALSNWTALCRYCDDGRLEIDNNGSERSLRTV
ncbi:MAG: IS66 family insertion sequence element accessory protein TnpB, partial [Planctomycetota bacterium]